MRGTPCPRRVPSAFKMRISKIWLCLGPIASGRWSRSAKIQRKKRKVETKVRNDPASGTQHRYARWKRERSRWISLAEPAAVHTPNQDCPVCIFDSSTSTLCQNKVSDQLVIHFFFRFQSCLIHFNVGRILQVCNYRLGGRKKRGQRGYGSKNQLSDGWDNVTFGCWFLSVDFKQLAGVRWKLPFWIRIEILRSEGWILTVHSTKKDCF